MDFQKVIWAGFWVQLIVFIFNLLPLPEPLLWLAWSAELIIFIFALVYFSKRIEIDKTGFRLISLFILWLLIEIIIASTHANGYWIWKFVIRSLFTVCFYVIIWLAAYPPFLNGILRLFWKYYLPLVGISFIFFSRPNTLNYLPYTFLLLFLPLIPQKKAIRLLGIVLIFFLFEEQRNDKIKIIVLLLIALAIYYFSVKILKQLAGIGSVVLMFLPFLLLYLGVIGVFNIFKMDEYIKGDITVKVTNASGEVVDDNLKADTRTFIYQNVFYTMNKYDAWLMGRSPAFGDEGIEGYFPEFDPVSGLRGRYGNEVQVLNLLLWYGLVAVFLYFLMYFRACYLAIFRSKSKFMVGIGLYVSFLWAWAFVWEVANFEIYFMMNIALLGVSYSKSFRRMTDRDFKLWVGNIFSSSSKLQIRKLLLGRTNL